MDPDRRMTDICKMFCNPCSKQSYHQTKSTSSFYKNMAGFLLVSLQSTCRTFSSLSDFNAYSATTPAIENCFQVFGYSLALFPQTHLVDSKGAVDACPIDLLPLHIELPH